MSEYIEIRGARENNLKDVSLRIPKRKITIFTGVSGSGKSSVVFDTIATEAQRQLYENFSMFIRSFLPRYPQPDALKETEGAILVGTRTFWEGVDVPGESVSMVVMDRVPFAPPDDPVAARLGEKAGERAFREVFLPKAQVAVRQGAGRLMRRSMDRGVVALLDPRVANKGGGK